MNEVDRFERLLTTYATASQAIYRKRVEEFKNFCAEENLNFETESLLQYLHFLRSDKEFEYRATTLWTIHSILNTWFTVVHGINPYESDPLIKKTLKGWSKADEITKASVFELEDIQNFLTYYPDSKGGLVMKVGVVLAIYGLLRRTELVFLTFEDLKFNADGVIVSIYRSKQAGAKKKFQYIITDDLSRGILTRYVHCFAEDKVGKNYLLINGLQKNEKIK